MTARPGPLQQDCTEPLPINELAEIGSGVRCSYTLLLHSPELRRNPDHRPSDERQVPRRSHRSLARDRLRNKGPGKRLCRQWSGCYLSRESGNVPLSIASQLSPSRPPHGRGGTTPRVSRSGDGVCRAEGSRSRFHLRESVLDEVPVRPSRAPNQTAAFRRSGEGREAAGGSGSWSTVSCAVGRKVNGVIEDHILARRKSTPERRPLNASWGRAPLPRRTDWRS